MVYVCRVSYRRDIDKTQQEPWDTDAQCYVNFFDFWELVTDDGDDVAGESSRGADAQREQHQEEQHSKQLQNKPNDYNYIFIIAFSNVQGFMPRSLTLGHGPDLPAAPSRTWRGRPGRRWRPDPSRPSPRPSHPRRARGRGCRGCWRWWIRRAGRSACRPSWWSRHLCTRKKIFYLRMMPYDVSREADRHKRAMPSGLNSNAWLLIAS